MPIITESAPIAFSDPLPEAVDVVIIGAGVIGTSTAWFLAKQGAKVLLCEKGRVAGEQSSRNWGWVRQQGRDQAELPIMMESNRIWRDLARSTGEKDLGFTPSGCIYLAESERQLAEYESWHGIERPRLRHRARRGKNTLGSHTGATPGTRSVSLPLRSLQRWQPDCSGTLLKRRRVRQPASARRRARLASGQTSSRS